MLTSAEVGLRADGASNANRGHRDARDDVSGLDRITWVDGSTQPGFDASLLPGDDAWQEARLGTAAAQRRARMERAVEPPGGLGGRKRELSPSTLAEGLLPHVLRATGMLRRGQANATRIEVTRNLVPMARLPPAFHGYTLLHLTDLHADLSAGAMRALPQAIAGLAYDACVITGDFRGRTFGPNESSLRLIRDAVQGIAAPLFGVLGNHDSARMVPGLEALGIQMLLNEGQALTRGTSRLWLAGVDDPHYYRLDDIRRAMAEVPDGEATVLLAHSTDCAWQAAEEGADLMLCGHTHGGQICLPGGVPVLTSSAMPRRLASGAWRVGQLQGYTSRGVGTSALDVRFNCPPEVTLHTLVMAP